MVRLQVDQSLKTPVLRQIVDGLRVHLVSGELPPGSALPSVRRMAMELGVHFNTVAEAYRELAAEGWLDLERGRKALVIARNPVPVPDASGLRERLRAVLAEMKARGLSASHISRELRAAERLVTRWEN